MSERRPGIKGAGEGHVHCRAEAEWNRARASGSQGPGLTTRAKTELCENVEARLEAVFTHGKEGLVFRAPAQKSKATAPGVSEPSGGDLTRKRRETRGFVLNQKLGVAVGAGMCEHTAGVVRDLGICRQDMQRC